MKLNVVQYNTISADGKQQFIFCEVGPLTQCLHKFKCDLMQGEVTCSCVCTVVCQKQRQLMTIRFWFELQVYIFFFLFGNTWLIQITTCLCEPSVPKMIMQEVWSEGSVSCVELENELELLLNMEVILPFKAELHKLEFTNSYEDTESEFWCN